MNINEKRYEIRQIRVNLLELSDIDLTLETGFKELEVLEKEVVDLLENKYMCPVTPIETMYGERIYEGDCILQTLSLSGNPDVLFYGRVRKHDNIYVIANGTRIVPLVRLDATNKLYYERIVG